MTDDGLTPTQRAFLSASQLREAVEDLSAAEINRLPMTDYAKLRERAGLPAVDPFADVYAPALPGRPRMAQAPDAQAPEPQDPGDFSQLSMAEYAAIRDRYIRPSSGTGRGIFGN